jgi:hypothetical protein
MTATRQIAAASLALLALLLTGCTVGGSNTGPSTKSTPEAAGEQTVREACGLMQGSFEQLAALTSGGSDLTSDQAAAVAALTSIEASMHEAADQVTNAEIADAAAGAADSMTTYVQFLESVIADPSKADPAKLGEQVAMLQAGLSALTEACNA